MEQPRQNSLFYFQMEDKIAKLFIHINIAGLEEIIEQMVLNCSRIIRVENALETTYCFRNYDKDSHYRDVSEHVLTRPYYDKDDVDIYCPGKRIVSYTHYEYPYFIDHLMDIVNRVKRGESVKLNLKFPEESKEDYLEKIRKGTMKIREETANVIEFPKKDLCEYYDQILNCISVFGVEIMPIEIVRDFMQYFEFIRQENLEFPQNVLQMESMDPLLREHFIRQMKALEGKSKKYDIY